MSDILIRRADEGDAREIGEIYDEAIADGIATFATGPHTEEERIGWLHGRAATAPVYVAATQDEPLVGWAAIAPFSHRPWYSGVGEYTVYVRRSMRGRGIGGLLLNHLVVDAPVFGYWKLVGMIFPHNTAGLSLARSHGFRDVGVFRAHGQLDERWHDIHVLERHLSQEMP